MFFWHSKQITLDSECDMCDHAQQLTQYCLRVEIYTVLRKIRAKKRKDHGKNIL